MVTAVGLQHQSATVDGGTLTLTYNEELDTGVSLGSTAFAVNVNEESRSLIPWRRVGPIQCGCCSCPQRWRPETR